MKRIGTLSVAFAAMLAVACGGDGRDRANNPANDSAAVGTTGNTANRVNDGARRWLEQRMQGNMAEVKLGELAQQKGQHADVKSFGRMMVTDHTAANDELKTLATKHNVQPPIEVADEQRDKAEELAKKEAREFDSEYAQTMVDAHQDTLEALEDRLDKTGDDANPTYAPKQSDDAFDADLNRWAAKTAPTVRQHLDRAKKLKDTLDRRTTDNR